MAKSPEELAHQEWLGYVQPVGLVVSIPALLEAQCYVNQNSLADHARFLSCLPQGPGGERIPELRDLPEFTRTVLGWEGADLREIPPRGALAADLAMLEVVLPQYNETLRPTHAVPVFKPAEGQNPWLMLIQEVPSDRHLDEPDEADSARHWNAPPQAKFERLLRETGVSLGLLSNRRQLRLVYAPKGESSGHATFPVAEMMQVAGRPMFAALHMLLCADRMFSLGADQRLPAILHNSRKYQNTVSTKLAEQVLAALYELMRGFQAANDVRQGDLLREVLATDPNHVYGGLLRVLMRLVFVLYAEDRNLLSSDPVYSNFYSVTGLFNRLREDAGRHPDTMNQRYGAWAQLLTLFRLIYEGGQHGDFRLPARKGYLFDPERYPFLEGRVEGGGGSVGTVTTREEKHGDSELSRLGSLAEGNGPVGGVLSGHEELSEGRIVRNDQPNSPGLSLDSGEHRGGAGTAGNQGVSELPGNSPRVAHGSGDAPVTQPASRAASRAGVDRAAGADRPDQPHAGRPKKIPGKTPLTPPLPPPPSPLHTPLTPPPPTTPRISDGVVYKVLRNLLILDGERLSYRTLDVEQIGSVYETVMGFNLEVAQGRSIAIKPVKPHGAPATINLSALFKTPGKDRAKWLKEHSDQTLGKEAAKQLKEAESLEQLLQALDKKIARKVTPRTVPKGAMVLQPSDERRRSGSHYTPRSLTEPIVRTTLEPILKQLYDPEAPLPEVYQPSKEDKRRYTQGEIDARIRLSERALEQAKQARAVGTPHPSQILDLKICDPAMGSGAFLVEACRQLADELVKAWYAHGAVMSGEGRVEGDDRSSHPPPPATPHYPPTIPPDEDEVLYARRQVAQRCLYGVDKNEMAVDLAKLSLWLVTLAKDHPFTFLDHSLRHGDSLVGLTRQQIIGFHWEPKKQKQFGEDLIQKRLDRATEARAKILNAREDVPYRDQEQRLAVADEALNVIRLTGDACVSAFFAGSKAKEREKLCEELFLDVARHFQALKDGKFDVEARSRLATAVARLRTARQLIPPFHWEIELPEVFFRANGGFDGFLGNPPFLGGSRISTEFGMCYFDWLKTLFPPAGHLCDLVAHFYRRAFQLTRVNGTFGLIATKTISQGDTREGGLRIILKEGGTIYAARTHNRWPGVAAVVVHQVFVIKSVKNTIPTVLDSRRVSRISAYLVEGTLDESPYRLSDNPYFSAGSKIYGQGFLFDDTDIDATPLKRLYEIRATEPNSAARVIPYIGGEEVNSEPQHSPHRFVIYLSDLDTENDLDAFPSLREIVETRVRPGRMTLGGNPNNIPLKRKWWAYQAHRPELYIRIRQRERIVAMSQVTAHFAFAILPSDYIYAHTLNVFDISSFGRFACLQSRVHEIWTRFFASSLEDRLRYTPSDCFATFAFPPDDQQLMAAGETYVSYRASLMGSLGCGLTSTYNRFHDPYEKSPEIQKLRDLHEAMDRAVLEAYGWHDLAQTAKCEFLLDYEEEEDSGFGVGGSAESRNPKPQSRRRKPYRLRWPDDFRDEVLARLLELNEQRHKEELLAARTQSSEKKQAAKKDAAAKPKRARKKSAEGQKGLEFDNG